MTESVSKQRKRSCNFTSKEVEKLVSLVIEHKEQIECKKTDCITLSEKEDCWERVTILFNNEMASGRSKENLKSKWEFLKKITRNYGEPSEPYMGPIGEKILKIIGPSGTGTVSAYDCDADHLIDAEMIDINNIHPALQLQNEELIVTPKNVYAPKLLPAYRSKKKKTSNKKKVFLKLAEKKIELAEIKNKILIEQLQRQKEKYDVEMAFLKEKHELEMQILNAQLNKNE